MAMPHMGTRGREAHAGCVGRGSAPREGKKAHAAHSTSHRLRQDPCHAWDECPPALCGSSSRPEAHTTNHVLCQACGHAKNLWLAPCHGLPCAKRTAAQEERERGGVVPRGRRPPLGVGTWPWYDVRWGGPCARTSTGTGHIPVITGPWGPAVRGPMGRGRSSLGIDVRHADELMSGTMGNYCPVWRGIIVRYVLVKVLMAGAKPRTGPGFHGDAPYTAHGGGREGRA